MRKKIRSYSDPYSVRMRENKDKNKSKDGHFLRGAYHMTQPTDEIHPK